MRFIKDITDFIFVKNKPQKADIIFVPGGSYPEIAENAASLWKDGFSSMILPSGKFSCKKGSFPGTASKLDIYNKKYNTEWEFLKDVLIQNGVAESSILKEDQATNTYENAQFSKKVTNKQNINVKTAIVCCKAFHARRCLMYYEFYYPKTKFIICPAETQGINKENWFKTNEGIDKVMGELARCGSQFQEMLKTFENC